jgi:predicted Zn-dependent protease with MMP-like domain
MRGPAFRPSPLAPDGVPARLFGAERFDAAALAVMAEVVEHSPPALADVELAVEEVPVLPPGWSDRTVPLSSFVDPAGQRPGRLVLFRRPLEHRAEGRADLEGLILTVVVEQLADVLGMAPEDLHPGYEPDED